MDTERFFLPELLFDFCASGDGTHWRCELRDHAEFGVLTEVYRNDVLFESQRFAPWTDPAANARARAIQWAVEKRHEIEAAR